LKTEVSLFRAQPSLQATGGIRRPFRDSSAPKADSPVGFFLPNSALAGIPFGDLRQPLGAKIMCREIAV